MMKTKISRERLLLGGLLLAAGVGFGADQLLFASPEVSAADEYALPSSPSPAPKAPPITSERQLALRLQQLAGPAPEVADDVRDVFGGSPPAVIEVVEAEPEPVAVPAAPVVNPIAGRVLNGTLFGADGKGVAIVDGRMIRLGSRLDGLRLIRVTKTVAVFSDGTHEFALHLSQR